MTLAVLVGGCGFSRSAPVAEPDLVDGRAESLLVCNTEAVGEDALSSVEMLTYRLEIEEPSFKVDAVYRVRRSGEVRVDIFMDDTRVMSEGWDEQGESSSATLAVTTVREIDIDREGGFDQPLRP